MKNNSKHEQKNTGKMIRNVIIAILFVVAIAIVLNIAPDYIRNDEIDKTNLIINNNNVTSKMDKDVYIDEKGNIYLAKEDVAKYFDKYITFDNDEERLITTSNTKIAVMKSNEKNMKINGSNVSTMATLIEKDGTIYLPFSDMAKLVYNVELNYIEETDTVTLDSLDRQLLKGDASKNLSVKYKAKTLSKTVDKIKKGDKVIVISKNDGWAKIRTERGKIGYVKENDIANINEVRQNMEKTKQIDGKINLVWDYYSEYASAPNRNGTQIEGVNVVSPAFFSLNKDGKIIDNVGEEGKKYIEWAHSNNYKVWPMFSNNSLLNTTSEILNDYEKREKLIDIIIGLVEKYELDGINLDFENMKQEDKNVYSRLVIELEPRLADMGKVLSVDVTAPDGSETWSLCFNRNVIADVADYIVFMAYDQNGVSSPKEGTTAGYNWVEANINKFLGQEDVDAEKIILGIPFYTRLWTLDENESVISNPVVSMKNIDSVIPNDVEKIWNDDLKQYYVEYMDGKYKKKIWIEDTKSISEKLSLVKSKNLAGVASWRKDMEDINIWKVISSNINE